MEYNNQVRIADIQQETQKKLDKVQETVSGQIETINSEVGQVKGQVGHIQEELGILQNRPMHCYQNVMPDHRETINFRDYKRNPMEFLERVTEFLNRTRENRWSIIRNFLDEGFKGINGNWWSTIRNEVHNLSLIHI